MSTNVPNLDHLVYATPDLEATCRDLEVRLGVRASAIDRLTAPKLITWAVRIDDLQAFVKEVSPNPNVGLVRSGSRKTPEGTTPSWQLTEPQLVQGVGLAPFLIEWNSRQHPADSAITGPRLAQLHLEHPEPELIRKQLNSLRVEVAIEQQPNPALVAIFEGANDPIELK